MADLGEKIAILGILGIGAQWAAWRFRLPTVVLLAAAGLVIGPLTGYIDPAEDFGGLFRPAVAIAVAIILFDGGLSLNLKEIRQTSVAVRRMILIGSPVAWLLATVAAHFIAGLSLPTAAVFGGILVVTGPTVVMPLLREARLKSGVASVLRWEGILVDPLGALFAVLAFEVLAVAGSSTTGTIIVEVVAGAVGAGVVGAVLGTAVVFTFRRGWAPEYLKAPILLALVIAGYECGNLLVDEGGLVTVTVMGFVVGNSGLAGLVEIRRFKENMTVILVSGVFILLTATIRPETFTALTLADVAFVAALLFLVRPAAVLLSTIGSGLDARERLFVAWIAPRGIVAVAVSGLFGASLVELGYADGEHMTALAFLVVLTTIILHGFSLPLLARRLDLVAVERPGVLIVGASPWSVELAKKLKETGVHVTVADSSWHRLRVARMAGIDAFYGDVLSEDAEHRLELPRFGYVIAASDDDAYNALLVSNFAPEIGRREVLTLDPGDNGPDLSSAMRGEMLGGGLQFWDIARRMQAGWHFAALEVTEKRSLDDMLAARDDDFFPLFIRKTDGRIDAVNDQQPLKPEPTDIVIGFGKPV